MSWLVTTTKATTLNIQYRSTSGKDIWLVLLQLLFVFTALLISQRGNRRPYAEPQVDIRALAFPKISRCVCVDAQVQRQ